MKVVVILRPPKDFGLGGRHQPKDIPDRFVNQKYFGSRSGIGVAGTARRVSPSRTSGNVVFRVTDAVVERSNAGFAADGRVL